MSPHHRSQQAHEGSLVTCPILQVLAAKILSNRDFAHYALSRSGMNIDQIDLVENNEAFDSVVLAWLSNSGADPDRVNVNGGAIAIDHRLGATGARLMATLDAELERTGASTAYR